MKPLGLLVLAALPQTGEPAPAVLLGYSAPASARQRDLERRFRAIPRPEEARRQHRFFTSEPHPAGSARNNELARHIADTWRRQGFEDVTLHRYDVLDTEPRRVEVEMVSPRRHRASLREDSLAADPDTRNPRVSGAHLGLSASGEVTAPVVYANSGNPEDYEVLRAHGIEVRGKVVLVRYSNPYSYRGFKALTAERAGAAALLVYSDPAEDGFQRGRVYPDGPWGPESHIQRGAITYDFLVPGDPTTPGWPSVPGARRVEASRAVSVPRIMAVPLSWRDAQPLLEHMGGPEAPAAWQGGLPLPYRLGGAARVRVAVDMDNRVRPNYVVEARIRGADLPDQWVVLGNHRDAWVFGGVDPSSGTASMMEMARAFAELRRSGWRPRRTLVLCSWDGEEVGLTGSTEWGEQFAEDLRAKAVAYLNVDSSASGPDPSFSAVASLAPLLVEVSRDLAAPTGSSLYQAWRDSTDRRRRARGEPPAGEADLVDTRIGSGSDHTVFLNHLGRPTVGLSFEGPYGVYHSVYDSFRWMERYGDPGHRYQVLMAQYWGSLALRLANAEVLPLDVSFYAATVRGFVAELEASPAARVHPDLSSLKASLHALERSGARLRDAVDAALATGGLRAPAAARLNAGLLRFEGNWLDPEGIPGRPWFKHLLYAARYTYAHLELPGLTEAVEEGDAARAADQARRLEAAVKTNTALVDDLVALAAAGGS